MEALWIGFAFILGLLCRCAGVPALIGYLGAGFLLNALGYQEGETLEKVAHLGVLLLLFTVGLNLRLRNVIQKEVWATAFVHTFITGMLFFLVLYFVAELNRQAAIMLGIGFAFSSTVIAAKVLEEKHEVVAFHGRVAIGILIFQDIIAVGLLSFFGGKSPPIWAFAVLALPLLRPLLHRMMDLSGHDELFLLFGLVLAICAGGLGFEFLELSPELGAIVFGALLADHSKAKELSNLLWGLKELMLVGFFLQIGMTGLPTTEHLLLALLLALFLPLKAILFFFLLLLFNLRARSAFLTGLSLASYSEFGLIVAQLATRNGWLEADWLVLLAITVAASFVVASPLYRAAHGLYERFEPALLKLESQRRHPDDEPVSLGNAHILIMGMGKIGTGAYTFLTRRGERIVGLDSDPAKVHLHRRYGRRVLYADAEDPGLWHHLDISGIRAVLLTMPDTQVNRDCATQLRKHNYQGLISATSRFEDDPEQTQDAGADMTLNIYHEAGVGFAEHVWEALYPKTVQDAVDTARESGNPR